MCASLVTLPLSLFQGYGIELEYMIVEEKSLDILPICDKLLEEVSGERCSEYEKAGISWTNELVMHLIEFKTTVPEKKLDSLAALFLQEIQNANQLLKKLGAKLMPTAMHPWMNPFKEMHLWPHEQNEIYSTFNKIFDCRGHGWANLQSCHINLPFGNEEEFGLLHSAIRLVLPLIPALAASSPIVEGKLTPYADYRLHVYQKNAAAIPSIAGAVIPEICRTYEEYKTTILNKIYSDISPYDPDKILQYDWCNSRGAITRFERQSIEIRLVDIQECPEADIAIALAIISVVRALVENRWDSMSRYHNFSEFQLKGLLDLTVKEGEKAFIEDSAFLSLFSFPQAEKGCSAAELWEYLIKETIQEKEHAHQLALLEFILKKGSLATRIRQALPPKFSKKELYEVYQKLCTSLAANTLFV